MAALGNQQWVFLYVFDYDSGVENLPHSAKVCVFAGTPSVLMLGVYEKIHDTAQKRSVRRWIKQMFSSLIKRQNLDCQKEIAKVIEMLQEIEKIIDIIARQIARQAKQKE